MQWLQEDVGLLDLTSYPIPSEREAIAEIVTRERCIVACSEEAAEIFLAAGASEILTIKHSGDTAEPQDVVLRVRGDPYSLLSTWRVAQNIVSFFSGVATKARKLVEAATRVSRRVVVSTTRKTLPGLRKLFIKAVLAGGASIHRLGLFDSILVFKNHVRLVGGWRNIIELIESYRKLFPGKKICIEVDSVDEAVEAARMGVDAIQLDRLDPESVRRAIEIIRRIRPSIWIAVAGNIDEHNIAEYAALEPNEIVTSAPYHAKPIDMTTHIRPNV